MDNEIDSKTVAEWHRNEANKHQELASFHKKTAETIEAGGLFPERWKPAARQELPVITAARNVTLEQLEAALHKKRGRVAHVAQRLKTLPAMINELLKNPNCQYVVGPRGFIYHKNDLPQ